MAFLVSSSIYVYLYIYSEGVSCLLDSVVCILLENRGGGLDIVAWVPGDVKIDRLRHLVIVGRLVSVSGGWWIPFIVMEAVCGSQCLGWRFLMMAYVVMESI